MQPPLKLAIPLSFCSALLAELPGREAPGGASPLRALAAQVGGGTAWAAEVPTSTATSTRTGTATVSGALPRPDPVATAAPTPPPASTSSASAAEEGPAAIGVRVGGYAQLDFQSLDLSSDQLSDDTGRSLNEDRFLVRRARVRLAGDWTYLGFVAEANFTTSQGPELGVRALEGLVKLPGDDRAAPPLVALGAGIFEVPFGFEVYGQGNRERLFTERALMAQAFAPGEFDVGARLFGAYRWVRWVLAVQNGEPIGERSYPLSDPNADKDLVGRLGVDAELAPWLRLKAAVSALNGHGFHAGTVPTKDGFVWRDFNEDGIVTLSELQTIPGAAATPSSSFRRFGLGADLQLFAVIPWLGELMVYGEIASAVNLDRGVAPADPVFLGRDQRSSGFYLAFTQELGAHAMVGARYDSYDPSADALDTQNGRTVVSRRTFKTLTLAAAGRLALPGGSSGRLVAELQLQDNGLGRDAAGLPAKLDNDVLRLRLEVAF